MNILLLNASYEPLTVVSLQRAMSLLLRDRVDAATDMMRPVRGGSTVFEIPQVIRLRKYVNVPSRGARWSRQAVLQRDQFTCIYCGIQAGARQHGSVLQRGDFTLDHIRPRSRGGKNTWGNTACACPVCNQRKGNRMPNEAGMKLLWEPKIPRVNTWVLDGEIPEAWKVYLSS
ncbi:MAG: HNH endonuclease [Anaerolineae bacterium]|nr:HNH endonuclease [Anaerolineae bacterium]MCO5206539.1 HNH endonuclease [Anaerolineae bacterium]